jgi:hypothetical protein
MEDLEVNQDFTKEKSPTDSTTESPSFAKGMLRSGFLLTLVLVVAATVL